VTSRPADHSKEYEIVWSPLAVARLQEIRAYIALDRPAAAERLAMRVVALTEALKTHPHLGRAGAKQSIREIILGGTPYIILYRIHHKRILISTIRHASQAEG
jgi:toxin ParE1/3/4